MLFVDHSGSLGGAELYLADALDAFDRPTVVTFEEGPFPERLRAEGHTVCVAGTSKSRVHAVTKSAGLVDALRAIPSLLSLVAHVARLAKPADVIFANSQKALIVGALAGWWTGTPVIWNLHDILTADHFSAVNRRVAVLAARLFTDRVIVNSEATREAFVAAGGDPGATVLVYNGVDETGFDAVDDAAVRAARDEIGVGDAPCVGVFSRLAPWKGQHVLLEAVARQPELHAVVVGDALFPGDHVYARTLETTARRLCISDRVHFLGFREDVARWMRAVDVVAHTSTAPEPFGRVIIEGQMARTPVVAVRAGGALEIIDDGVNGRLTAPGDADELSAALAELIANPGLAQKLAETGRRTAERRFSLSATRRNLVRVVDAVSGRRTPSRS